MQYYSIKWPCRIGVISDTHIVDACFDDALLNSLQEEYFKGVDIILHAGDLVDTEILTRFSCCPILAVCGNMDEPAVDLPMRRVLSVGPFRIGLIHGWGPPNGLEQRLLREFSEENIDCMVYGHSHMPTCRRQGDQLLFNPGSPTDRRRAPFHSVGILEVGDSIQGRIISLD
jgi:hypothetical protein